MIAESEMQLQVHRCDERDPRPRWAPDPAVAERSARGNALVRETIAAAKAKKLIDEKEQT
jgi:uncharacterized membrane protein YebE (DUF533 family)